jgi:hypothetical protein
MTVAAEPWKATTHTRTHTRKQEWTRTRYAPTFVKSREESWGHFNVQQLTANCSAAAHGSEEAAEEVSDSESQQLLIGGRVFGLGHVIRHFHGHHCLDHTGGCGEEGWLEHLSHNLKGERREHIGVLLVEPEQEREATADLSQIGHHWGRVARDRPHDAELQGHSEEDAHQWGWHHTADDRDVRPCHHAQQSEDDDEPLPADGRAVVESRGLGHVESGDLAHGHDDGQPAHKADHYRPCHQAHKLCKAEKRGHELEDGDANDDVKEIPYAQLGHIWSQNCSSHAGGAIDHAWAASNGAHGDANNPGGVKTEERPNSRDKRKRDRVADLRKRNGYSCKGLPAQLLPVRPVDAWMVRHQVVTGSSPLEGAAGVPTSCKINHLARRFFIAAWDRGCRRPNRRVASHTASTPFAGVLRSLHRGCFRAFIRVGRV